MVLLLDGIVHLSHLKRGGALLRQAAEVAQVVLAEAKELAIELLRRLVSAFVDSPLDGLQVNGFLQEAEVQRVLLL